MSSKTLTLTLILTLKGINELDRLSSDGQTAILYALMNGHAVAAKELILQGSNPWAHEPTQGH